MPRAGSSAPCPRPSRDSPFPVAGKVASVWHYIPEAPDPPASAADLARLLRDLHSRPLPPSPPEAFTDPLAGVTAALESAPADAIASAQRDWLADEVQELSSTWAELRFPTRPA